MLTCGDLGNDTDAFEDRLQMAFLRAANWGAILLLEEADVFVRSLDDGTFIAEKSIRRFSNSNLNEIIMVCFR